MASSSLQRALAASSLTEEELVHPEENNNKNTLGGCGTFESCFARGLDLSEFASRTGTTTGGGGSRSSSSSSSSPPVAAAASLDSNPPQSRARISAASQLLAVRAEESQKRMFEEKEEARMLQLARRRAKSLIAQYVNINVDRSEHCLLSDALIGMHRSDAAGAASEASWSRRQRHKQRRLKQKVRKSPCTRKGKRPVTKKAGRTKH